MGHPNILNAQHLQPAAPCRRLPSLLHILQYPIQLLVSIFLDINPPADKMKSLALLVAAGVALAQDIGGLPACGQTCITNMLAIAQSTFGCAPGDVVCYCSEPRFGYGVRDCSNEACSPEDAASAISYGTSYCASAAASASGASATAVSTGALGILSSALDTATPTATGADTTMTTMPSGTGGAASSIASSLGSELASATGSAQSGLSSIESSAASAASSAAASASDAASSAASSISSALESLTGSPTGSGTGVQSTGGAPKMTGLPLAGAAGLAAALNAYLEAKSNVLARWYNVYNVGTWSGDHMRRALAFLVIVWVGNALSTLQRSQSLPGCFPSLHLAQEAV